MGEIWAIFKTGRAPGWMMRLPVLMAICTCCCRGQITFPGFENVQGLHLLKAASRADGVLRLTPAQPNRSGAAWFGEKQTVVNGFETEFRFQLTGQGGLGKGADGFAFVLQNSGPAAIAGTGSSGGWALGNGIGDRAAQGIPLSIAIFFDTYRNEVEGDPSNNYLAICTNGKIGEMAWPPSRLAKVRKLRVNLKDRKAHLVRIVYRPPVLSVYLDGAPALASTVDVSFVADREGASYVGFTASTGAGYENHDILSWKFGGTEVSSSMAVVSSEISFLKAACLPDRNLCTPERAAVEQTGPGKYHVVLPANVEWGASVPGRLAAIGGQRGMVCWDLQGRGAEGCGGPGGRGAGGKGFLVPGSPAGALVTKTRDGRTYFTVNDRSGAFADNEGYFEFDVEARP
jgi:hypothetical protein